MEKTGSSGGFYYWSFFIHKWAGLIGAVWLAVLGVTGFFLDHDSWRWLQQGKAPAWLSTQSLDQNSARNVLRMLQVDPDDRQIQIGGGARGLWASRDGGKNWTPTAFAAGDHPQVLAIEPDPARGWGALWLATDDGVYMSKDKGATARPVSLMGEYVTSLAAGARATDMLGVIDKSKVFAFSTDDPGKITTLDIAPLPPDQRPADVQLNRFMRELHFGKGINDQMSSLVLNDVGGVAMFVLSLTGLLYWGLPKWWKSRAGAMKAKGVKPNKAARRATIVWLFRLHSATLGIVSAVMLLYLSITGIFIGHGGRELRELMRGTRVPQAYLTPSIGLSNWSGMIDSIVGYPDAPGVFSIGSRLGLFTTGDNGQSWAREEGADGKPVTTAQRMRRIGDKIMLANGMAAASQIRNADATSREVKLDEHVGAGGHGHRHGGSGGGMSAMGMGAMGMGAMGMGAMGMGAMGMGDGEHMRHRGGGERDGATTAEETPREATQDRGEEEGAGMGRRRQQATEMGMGGMEGMFMPTDVSRSGDRLLWKSSNKLYVTDENGKEIERFDVAQPQDPGTPWFSWMLRLHVGTIFWSEWRWVNDVFATLAVFLTVTGLIRWWRQKWI
jgi:hypothetical protein